MTRINVVPPAELSRQHLVAEYREITRLPGNLYNWINRKSKPPSFNDIPTEYKLGTGHVTFFYDKFKYLELRFEAIIDEMLERGYNPNFTDSGIFRRVDKLYYNDYTPTEEAIAINRQRIKERTK